MECPGTGKLISANSESFKQYGLGLCPNCGNMKACNAEGRVYPHEKR